MKIQSSLFGNIQDQQVDLYTLENNNGMTVKISTYGATVTSIQTPDKDGTVEEITCGFDTLESYFSEAYKNNSPYFGGTVGRYCSQIKDAKFSLNGEAYELASNCGPNNLHGGAVGFDKKIWEAKTIENGVEFSLYSKDLEEGFPGNVEVTVTYTLSDANELKIDYSATPDKDTPLAMTNHTYFNLNGFKSNVECHTAKVNASKKQVWDETGAATGENVSVEGKADDLREPKRIGDVHDAIGDGFEHFYVLDEPNFDLKEFAEVACPKSGRSLTVSTTEVGMLLYTGKYTSDDLKRENGLQYGKYRGFCCEAHRFPNGPNIDAPKAITKAGEEFTSTTVFKFNW